MKNEITDEQKALDHAIECTYRQNSLDCIPILQKLRNKLGEKNWSKESESQSYFDKDRSIEIIADSWDNDTRINFTIYIDHKDGEVYKPTEEKLKTLADFIYKYLENDK